MESRIFQYLELIHKQLEDLPRVFATKEDLREIKEDLKGFATKDDLMAFATKDDLKAFATKDDLKEIKEELKGFATKDDLKGFATKDDLKDFATKDDLKGFATKDDLKDFATKDDLKAFATKEDLYELFEATRDGFNRLDARMDGLERRLTLVELSMEDMRSDLRAFSEAINANTEQIDLLKVRVDKLESRAS
ncbi:MAG: hypothetical protein WC314_15560 [Vulcanimicrobiota bacterium]